MTDTETARASATMNYARWRKHRREQVAVKIRDLAQRGELDEQTAEWLCQTVWALAGKAGQ